MTQGKRAIFQEIGTDKSAAPATSAQGVIDRGSKSGARAAVRLWMMILFALVVVMIAVGGLTRLTDSGL